MKTLGRYAGASLATAVGAALAVLGPVQTASAVTTYKVNNNCDYRSCAIGYSGRLFLYYNSKENDGYYSGLAHFYGNVYDYAGETVSPNGAIAVRYDFVFGKNNVGNTASGTGVAVKNNAAMVENCAPYDGYRVYYNSGYQGSSQYFDHTYGSVNCAGGKSVNLNSTLKNNNASQHFA
ncbi:hypothetical protein [Streptomyces fragilis]|uniref:Uncharacterized protein n=1 Tax=Streptomyces fragilis TaxID=67301 RepID=A0ABV2YCM3_9ACTN|nr:hypothetical protein [Streptomyces fragilis]